MIQLDFPGVGPVAKTPPPNASDCSIPDRGTRSYMSKLRVHATTKDSKTPHGTNQHNQINVGLYTYKIKDVDTLQILVQEDFNCILLSFPAAIRSRLVFNVTNENISCLQSHCSVPSQSMINSDHNVKLIRATRKYNYDVANPHKEIQSIIPDQLTSNKQTKITSLYSMGSPPNSDCRKCIAPKCSCMPSNVKLSILQHKLSLMEKYTTNQLFVAHDCLC